MYFLIETYPEFTIDLQDIWKSFIEENNFKLYEEEEGIYTLENEIVKLILIVGGSDRIGYQFINPKTNVLYIEKHILLFYGKYPYYQTTFNSKKYPIPQDEWFNLYAKDNYQAICRIDLPILLEEIIGICQPFLNGDFSIEPEFLKWGKWKSLPENKRKSAQELSYAAYLEELKNNPSTE